MDPNPIKNLLSRRLFEVLIILKMEHTLFRHRKSNILIILHYDITALGLSEAS